MNKIEAQVREFHALMKLPARDIPVADIPDDEFDTRVTLNKEEFTEFEEEVEKGDDVLALAKESIDMIYTGVGALITMGFPLQELFDEVHRSNMSKAPICEWCHGEKEITKVGGIKEPCGMCAGRGYKDPLMGKGALAGKVLKPKTYSEPDLEGALLRYVKLVTQG